MYTDVESYIRRMTDSGFRQRYRMSNDAFWTLLEIIERRLPNTGKKRKRGAVPNGPITRGRGRPI